MLHVGLTGGIGAGKSTVAAVLAELGATVVDADALARQVVAPGTPGLQEVLARFGTEVLDATGALDRTALGRLVFADDEARRALERIVHPRVRSATAEQVRTARPGGVVVHDVPLIAEKGLAPDYHLVLVVDASEEERVRRLVADRGMTPDEAGARIRAQADQQARRAVADVWLDTRRDRAEVQAEVVALWEQRLRPYARNVEDRRTAPRPPVRLVPPPEEGWTGPAERLLARLRRVGGDVVRTADHVGSTAVPGLDAKDVLDLQLGVTSLREADALVDALAEAGFPRVPGEWTDAPRGTVRAAQQAEPHGPQRASTGAGWDKRLHANADPGRAVNLHVRTVGGPGWRFALAFRDWLRADPGARAEYLGAKRSAEPLGAGYAAAKEPWFDRAAPRLEEWVAATGWRPGS